MNGGILALTLASIMLIAAGAYLSFVGGQTIGVVFMGTGGVFLAIAAMRNAQNKKGNDDAG